MAISEKHSDPAALWSVKTVAQKLQICPRHVWKLASSNKLPQPVRLGGSVRWRSADIELFIATGCDMPAFEKARAEKGRS